MYIKQIRRFISTFLMVLVLVSITPLVPAQNVTDFVIQESLTGINYNDTANPPVFPVQSGEYVTFYPFGAFNTFSTTGTQDCSGSYNSICAGVVVEHTYYTSNYDESLTKHTVTLQILYTSPYQVNVKLDTYPNASFHTLKIYEYNGWVRIRNNLQIN